jgi:hypothetical protein
MKPMSDFRPFAGWRFNFHAASVAVALALPLLFGGCSKKTDAPASNLPATPQAAAPTSAAPTPPIVASMPAPATATNAAPDLRAINRALIIWSVHHRRQPSSFEEFAASAGFQIPPPPPGKKYVIDSNGLISLVNR